MVFRMRYEQKGNHIHMRLFSAKQTNFTFAKLGDLTCSTEEFVDLQAAMAGVQFLPEEEHD